MRLWLVLLLLSLPGECSGGSGDLVPPGTGQGTESYPRQRGGVISGEMRGGFVNLFSKSTLGSYFVPGIHQPLRT